MSLPVRPVAHTPRKDDPTSWHYLDDHLNAVADMAEAFAGKFGAGELGSWAGLLHDLGKYHPEFQAYLIAEANGEHHSGQPHAVYGAAYALEKNLATLMLIVYGHHVGLQDPSSVQDKSHPVLEDEVLAKILTEASKHFSIGELEQAIAAEQALQSLDVELFIRMLFSALIDADHLDTEAHFEPGKGELRKAGNAGLTDFWTSFEQDQAKLHESAEQSPSAVNAVRREVYDFCINAATQPTGVFRLAVPTGGGKTRSSLAFALKHAEQHAHDRVIIAVPYTSIIEQTVDVYRDILGHDAVLEHHSASCTRLSGRVRIETHRLIPKDRPQNLHSLFGVGED